MSADRPVRINYSDRKSFKVKREQIVSGEGVINRVDKEVTSEIDVNKLPESLREEFLNGGLRIFSSDGDGRVIVRITPEPLHVTE